MTNEKRADYKTERTQVFGLNGQPREKCVRLFYRAPGSRRWNRRLVFAGDGLTLSMIEERAQEIADKLLREASGV